jgi:hypothetical protein
MAFVDPFPLITSDSLLSNRDDWHKSTNRIYENGREALFALRGPSRYNCNGSAACFSKDTISPRKTEWMF